MSIAAILWSRRVTMSAAFVIALPAADEDERHQPDTQGERKGDPESHRYPTGSTNVRIAEAGPEGDNHNADRQHHHHREHHREEIARGQKVSAGRRAG
jgi:hypothetical protein